MDVDSYLRLIYLEEDHDRVRQLLTDFEAQVRADERKSPAITKLVEAARNFAARVEERNPEWFREERGTTDFSEADHALRAALAELEKP